MIDTLKAIHEKVNFENESLILFYDKNYYQSYPLHWHTAMEIIMPVNNGYTVICDNITYQLRQGDILVIQPNVPHQMPASCVRRFICLASLQPMCSQNMYDCVHALFYPSLLLTPEKDQDLYEKVREQLYSICDEYQSCSRIAELSMYTAILTILTLIGKKIIKSGSMHIEDIEPERQMQTVNFYAIREYINNHYMERLTLEDIAKMSGFSRYHFDRLFKKYSEETFYQYLNKIRINNAVMLLSDSTFPITEIAYKSGFTTISSFIRMFRIHYNCTPSEYRSMYARKTCSNE
jgi:AraC-like DNA-binding protein